MENDTAPDFDSVMLAARQWLYAEIRSIVDSAISELHTALTEDADLDRNEWLTEYIDSITDSHNYVIYTAKAWMVCAASDNCDAYEDEMGEKPPTVEAQACPAMRADCWQLLGARSNEWEAPEPE